MDEGLRGKICIVTGGANGIGRAIAEAFHREGCRVVLLDKDLEGGVRAEQMLTGSRFMAADVSNAAVLEKALGEVWKEYGSIDVLVNNAGISSFAPLTETTVGDFADLLSVNLVPVFTASRFLALRREQEFLNPSYGRIINISSTRAHQSEPGTEAYSASKGGVIALTHALAASFSNTGVTVNCISPGWIDTGNYGPLTKKDHTQHLSGRVGIPEDVARLSLFLARPGSDFITGAEIVADGGMTRRMIYQE